LLVGGLFGVLQLVGEKDAAGLPGVSYEGAVLSLLFGLFKLAPLCKYNLMLLRCNDLFKLLLLLISAGSCLPLLHLQGPHGC
jgi:hypothetical protein